MRPFTSFDAAAPPDRVGRGEAARLRTDATVAWLTLAAGFAFLRQRSNFILGWEAAARADDPAAKAAGTVGVVGAPALGSWMMLPDLTSPATQTVLPMNDSLYGASHVELDRQGPVILTLPADHDGRYYSVSVMDAHWNNTLHLGPAWSGRDRVEVLLVPPGWQGQAPTGMRVVESPTVSVCLLNRVLVTYDNSDLDRVRSWRTGFRITPLSGELVDVPHDDLVHPEAQLLADPWRYFQLGFDHVRRNPLPAAVAPVLRTVDERALMRAADQRWSRAAVESGVADAQAIVDGTLTGWPRKAGWMVPPPWLGLPNPQVAENAALQLFQIGSNDSSEAVYFFGDAGAAGDVLDGSDDAVYELIFEAGVQPPVRDGGFWSLTMYGADNLLVDNAIGRYSTRPTRPGFRERPDGSIAITLSRSLPEDVAEANWLPAPAAPFRLGLRVYYPTPAVADGTWFPPAPRRIA